MSKELMIMPHCAVASMVTVLLHNPVTCPMSPVWPVCAAPVDTRDPPLRLSNLEQGELRGKSASAAAHTDNSVIGRLFCCFVNTVI